MDFFIGVNIGTEKVSAVLIDKELDVLADCNEPLNILYPHYGWAEQDPNEYWNSFRSVIQCVIDKSKVSPVEIAAISLSSQMMGLVVIDKYGNPLTNAIIWLDGRAVDESEELINIIGVTDFMERLGGVPTPKDVISKLLWLKKNRSDLYNQINMILGIKEYIIYKLTGRFITDYSSASATGLLDLVNLKWSQIVEDLLDLSDDMLPKLAWSIDIVGELDPIAGRQLGLSGSTIVINGCGDALATAVASGSVRVGEAHLHIGPSAWIGAVSDVRYSVPEHGMGSLLFIEPGKWLFLAENEVAGLAFKWLFENMLSLVIRGGNIENIEKTLAKAVNNTSPGSDGILFIPWLYGERSPIPEAQIRGVLLNLSLKHRADHIIRAMLEGIGFNLKYTLELFEGILGIKTTNIPILGEYARFNEICEILTDILQKTFLRIYNPAYAHAWGAAAIAAVGSGSLKSVYDVKKYIKLDRLYTPNSRKSKTYEEIYMAMKEVYQKIVDLYKLLYI